MRIGELTKKVGVSERTIRHYDAAGLLSSHRDSNGYRRFAPKAVAEVEWINQLTTEGFSLKQIQLLQKMRMQLPDDAAQMQLCLDLHKQKLKAIEQKISGLQQKHQRLLEKIQRFDPDYKIPNEE